MKLDWRTRCCYGCWFRYYRSRRASKFRWLCRACWTARLNHEDYQYHIGQVGPVYFPRTK
jgi:hypothetical protein